MNRCFKWTKLRAPLQAYLSKHSSRNLLVSQGKDMNGIALDCLLKSCNWFPIKPVYQYASKVDTKQDHLIKISKNLHLFPEKQSLSVTRYCCSTLKRLHCISSREGGKMAVFCKNLWVHDVWQVKWYMLNFMTSRIRRLLNGTWHNQSDRAHSYLSSKKVSKLKILWIEISNTLVIFLEVHWSITANNYFLNYNI